MGGGVSGTEGTLTFDSGILGAERKVPRERGSESGVEMAISPREEDARESRSYGKGEKT